MSYKKRRLDDDLLRLFACLLACSTFVQATVLNQWTDRLRHFRFTLTEGFPVLQLGISERIQNKYVISLLRMWCGFTLFFGVSSISKDEEHMYDYVIMYWLRMNIGRWMVFSFDLLESFFLHVAQEIGSNWVTCYLTNPVHGTKFRIFGASSTSRTRIPEMFCMSKLWIQFESLNIVWFLVALEW